MYLEHHKGRLRNHRYRVILGGEDASDGGGGETPADNTWTATAPYDFGLEGAVQFESSNFELTSAENVRIYVERNEGASGAASVDVSTVDVTGDCAMTAGTNYTAVTNETLSWADGEIGTKSVVVNINSTPTVGLHLIKLTLTNASTNLRIKNATAWIAIDDGGINPNATVITTSTSNQGNVANIENGNGDGLTYPAYRTGTAAGNIVVGDIAGTVNAASAGDLIYLRGGEYLDNRRTTGQDHAGVEITNGGTSAAPITVQGYPGESPVIDQQFCFNDDISGIEACCGIFIRNSASHLHFRDFEIRDTSFCGIMTDPNGTDGSMTDIVFSNLVIHNMRSPNSASQGRDNVAAIRLDNTADVIVYNCELYQVYGGQLTSNPIDSVPRGMGGGVHSYDALRGWVHQCSIYDVRSCVQAKQAPATCPEYYTIHNNLMYEFVDYGHEINTSGGSNPAPNNISFFRNVCETAESYGTENEAVGPSLSGANEQADGLFVYENTVYGADFAMASVGMSGIYFYSNNIDTCGRGWSVDFHTERTSLSKMEYEDYNNFSGLTQTTKWYISRNDASIETPTTLAGLQAVTQTTHDCLANTPAMFANDTETSPTYQNAAADDYRTTNMLTSGFAGRPQGIGNATVGRQT
jgi:hypothetical protein